MINQSIIPTIVFTINVLSCLPFFTRGEIIAPRHQAATVSDNATMQCRPSTDRLESTTAKWEANFYNLDNKRNIYNSLSTSVEGFTVNDSSLFDLTILDIDENNSGLYRCIMTDDGNTYTYEAELVLIKNVGCEFTTASGLENPEEEDWVLFTCAVDYYGPVLLEPEINWFENGEPVSKQFPAERPVVNPDYGWRTITRQWNTTALLDKSGVDQDCLIYWRHPVNSTNPTYASNCVTAYTVKYPPRNMTVTYNGITYTTGSVLKVKVGSSIRCSVSAYPPVLVTWNEILDNDPNITQMNTTNSNTALLEIDSSMANGQKVYECIAYQNNNNNSSNSSDSNGVISMEVKFEVQTPSQPGVLDNKDGASTVVHSKLILIILLSIIYLM